MSFEETHSDLKLQDKKIVLFYRDQSSDEIVIDEANNDIYLFHEIVDEKELWIDLGANIGVSTLSMALHGAKVHAYEPDPWSRSLLEKNVKENNLQDLVHVFEEGVSGDGGTYMLLDGEEEGAFWHQRLKPVSQVNSQENGSVLHTISFAEVIGRAFADSKRVCVKIDIEGLEYDVLVQTPHQVLSQLSKIVMEFHHDRLSEGQFEHTVRHLESAGFTVEFEEVTDKHRALEQPHLVWASRP